MHGSATLLYKFSGKSHEQWTQLLGSNIPHKGHLFHPRSKCEPLWGGNNDSSQRELAVASLQSQMGAEWSCASFAEESHSWEFLVSSKHSLNSFIILVSWIKAVRREHVKIAVEQDNGCKMTKNRKPLPEWFQVLLQRKKGSVKHGEGNWNCSLASLKWLVNFASIRILVSHWQKPYAISKLMGLGGGYSEPKPWDVYVT